MVMEDRPCPNDNLEDFVTKGVVVWVLTALLPWQTTLLENPECLIPIGNCSLFRSSLKNSANSAKMGQSLRNAH